MPGDIRRTGRQPSDADGERSDFADRNQDRIAECGRGDRQHAHQRDRDHRRAVRRVDAAERRVHEIAAPDRVQHPRRRDEVAVENLQQRQERPEQNELGDRVRAERALERHLGPHVSRHDFLPRVDERHHGDDDHVEQQSGEQRGVDRCREVSRIEPGARLFRAFCDRLPSGHVVRHDLHHEENREPDSARARLREERLPVRGRAAGKAEQREHRERGEQAERHDVLKDAARSDAAVIDEDDEHGERQADAETRRVDRTAGDHVYLMAVERREHTREQITGRDRFPRAHDRV